MNNQLYIFGIFILTGFLIGILFDIFRISRKTFKISDFITYIEDFIFWILTGLILLYCIFKFNNGELRLFIFMGSGLGFTLYLIVFSKPFIKVNLFIIDIIKKLFNYVFVIPLKFIFKIFRKVIFKPISFCIINVRKSLSNIIKKAKKVHNNKEISNQKKDLV